MNENPQNPKRLCAPLLQAVALTVAMCGTACAQDAPQMNLGRTQLSAGMHLIDAQVAQTAQQRQIGLMYRREMPQHEGMLFVFEQPATQCFWMKNTLLPLTAAFVADDGTIVNLARHEAADRGLPLLGEAGALCAGNEPGLVRQEEPQGWGQVGRGAVRVEIAGRLFAQASYSFNSCQRPFDDGQAPFWHQKERKPARGRLSGLAAERIRRNSPRQSSSSPACRGRSRQTSDACCGNRCNRRAPRRQRSAGLYQRWSAGCPQRPC